MVYIKLEENSKAKYENCFIKFIIKIKNRFCKLRIEKIENKTLLIIHDMEGETLKKLSKYIVANAISRVCLSDNLLNNEKFMDFIKNENVKIFDGKWLFMHLTNKCIDYILACKKEKKEYQEISILSNNINRIVVSDIKDISKEVKSINIITEEENRFRKLEKDLYSENGIILNMNNNYKKSLIKSDIIFNYDFTNDEINKYNIAPKSCIVNLSSNTININSKLFKGINCNNFEITFPSKYIKNLIYFRGFNPQILYESFIYKNTVPENIKKEIDDDKVNILTLIGKNGKIKKTEFNNLTKKVVN